MCNEANMGDECTCLTGFSTVSVEVAQLSSAKIDIRCIISSYGPDMFCNVPLD